MVEQRPFKPLAVSSSLTQPTILFWTSNGERPRRRPLEVKQIMQENAKKLGTFYCAFITLFMFILFVIYLFIILLFTIPYLVLMYLAFTYLAFYYLRLYYLPSKSSCIETSIILSSWSQQ